MGPSPSPTWLPLPENRGRFAPAICRPPVRGGLASSLWRGITLLRNWALEATPFMGQSHFSFASHTVGRIGGSHEAVGLRLAEPDVRPLGDHRQILGEDQLAAGCDAGIGMQRVARPVAGRRAVEAL